MTAPTARPADDTNWGVLLNAWTGHLHDADPLTLDHIAADAEYLPPSPLAERMRASVDAERDARQEVATRA